MRLALVLLATLLALPAHSIERKWDEGDLLGFSTLFDQRGERIGQGEFDQKASGKKLTVTSSYRFEDGRTAVETAAFVTEPELRQTRWSFVERRGEVVLRDYEVNLETGVARALKREGRKVRRRSGRLELEPGRTFAGLGFVFAAKNLMPTLRDGKPVQLTAVAFTPKPRKVKVELKSAGQETLSSGVTSVEAERIVVRAKLPRIARLFVHPKDGTLWFARRSPPQFLRSRATLAENSEELVQINSFGTSTRIGRRPAARPRD